MTKIEALRQTIYNVENDVYEYNWGRMDSCNCGVLARTLLSGKTPNEAGFDLTPKRGEIGEFASYAYCMTTNLPLPEVFSALKEAGFSHAELLELEYLANPTIANRAGWGTYCSGKIPNVGNTSYTSKESLIKYLKAWVEILKETENIPATEPAKEIKEKIRYVSVPASITEQTKELILQ